MTGAEAFALAVPRLRAAGVDSPERDARALLATAKGIDPGRLTLYLRDPLTEAEESRFSQMIDQRVARRPVAQIIGRRMFYGRWFKVTPQVLDPRPETETLIEQALQHSFTDFLDLGTGSGCIAITLLAERLTARGTATDISSEALDVAGGNASTMGVSDRLLLGRGDWYAGVEGLYDLIVSNPPYIAASEMRALAPEVRDHEPHMALTDGGDGLSCYRAIAGGAAVRLRPGGRLLVEIGAGQKAAVSRIFAAAGLEHVACHADLDGRDRMISGIAPG